MPSQGGVFVHGIATCLPDAQLEAAVLVLGGHLWGGGFVGGGEVGVSKGRPSQQRPARQRHGRKLD